MQFFIGFESYVVNAVIFHCQEKVVRELEHSKGEPVIIEAKVGHQPSFDLIVET